MINHILQQMPYWLHPVIITRLEWVDAFRASITRDPSALIGLDQESIGQSWTVAQGAQFVHDGVFYVQNCDVLFDRGVYRWLEWDRSQDVTRVVLHQDCRPSDAPPIFSYVDNPEAIVTIAEKRRISNWAASGLWRIASVKGFQDAVEAHVASGVRHNGELYLSDTLTMMKREKIGFIIQRSDFVDFGTPQAIQDSGGEIVESVATLYPSV